MESGKVVNRRKKYPSYRRMRCREAALLRWCRTLCGEPPPPMEASVPVFPPFQEAVHSIDPSHEKVVNTESQTPCIEDPPKGPKIEVDCATSSSTGKIVAGVDSCVAVAEGHHIDSDPHPPEDVLIGIDPPVAGVDSSVAIAEGRHIDPDPHPPEDVDCAPISPLDVDGPIVEDPQKGPKIEVACATSSSTGTIVASVDSSVEGRHIDPDPHPPVDVVIAVDCCPNQSTGCRWTYCRRSPKGS